MIGSILDLLGVTPRCDPCSSSILSKHHGVGAFKLGINIHDTGMSNTGSGISIERKQETMKFFIPSQPAKLLNLEYQSVSCCVNSGNSCCISLHVL